MLTPDVIRKSDRTKLYEDYENWPLHCRTAFEIQPKSPHLTEANSIVCAGMGGSGVIGDVLVDWLQSRIRMPIYVVKNNCLPTYIDNKSLIIIVSSSGNTDETVNVLVKALKTGNNIVTISAGGRLEKISLRRRITHIKVKKLNTARSSFPYLFYPIAAIIRNLSLLNGLEQEIDSSLKAVESMKDLIGLHIPIKNNQAKKLAKRISKRFPIVYSSQLLRCSALRFKNSLNENAKKHMLIDFLPELCHNEIETWLRDSSKYFLPLFLRCSSETPSIQLRFKVIRSIIEKSGFKVVDIPIGHKDVLSAIISSIYLLDYTSIYAACLMHIDPSPTPNIEELKRRIIN